MIRKSLSRQEMKQIVGGQCHWGGSTETFSCNACESKCIYEIGGPGAGCPPGGNCMLIECPHMAPCCDLYEEYRYRTVCDWELV